LQVFSSLLTLSLIFSFASMLRGAGDTQTLFRAIRNNHCKDVRVLIERGVSPDARDNGGTTALMYAALHADVKCMKLLLDRGADPKARNAADATALMWSVHDPAKVKLLLERGADPNAASKEGRTALLIAAKQDGAGEVIRMLLGKGADPNVRDALGGTALMLAAEAGDLEVVKLLVSRGADINLQAGPLYGLPRFGRPPEKMGDALKNARGITALIAAASAGNTECVRFLLEKGADPKLKAFRFSDALIASVQQRDPGIARLLIAKGADVNARDYRGATPLILAAASDETTTETIRMLLRSGADLQARDNRGNTGASFALKRGATDVVRALQRAGSEETQVAAGKAPPVERVAFSTSGASIGSSVEKSLALLQSSAVQFSKKTGCISCHHQSLLAMAASTARARGFRLDEEMAVHQVKATASVLAPHRETLLQAVPTVPATSIVSSYALVGLAAEGYPADEMTDAMVHELAARQRRDGRWYSGGERPPLDQGDITATALCMRSLQLYPLPGRKQEFDQRVLKAREWLLAAVPSTTQEKALRLLGIAWAKADGKRVRDSVHALLREQRQDGGWAPMSTLESDAYATGQVLVALHEAGVSPKDAVWRRGVEFLLKAQKEDGSWHVKSRALGFQPHFESGYPHGYDQWISAAGSAWATMALTLTAEPAKMVARRR